MEVINKNNRTKPTLYYMVGIPGSGKSSYVKQMQINKSDIKVHSSDAIREELGNINDQTHNNHVFNTLHKRVKEDLRLGFDVVYDSTGLRRKNRMAFLNEIAAIDCKKICILMCVPFEKCMELNNNRDRVVPEYVMWRMYKNFNVPTKLEGWDMIYSSYWATETYYYGEWMDFYNKTKRYNQCNHHHLLTLGNHCKAAWEYIADNIKNPSDELQFAAIFHDIGKVKVQTFVDSKGNPTDEAHYYGHENVSAYDVLFYNTGVADVLIVSLLIEMHMRPHDAWNSSQKAMNKDKKFLGDKLYNELLDLHLADLAAH